LHATVRLAPLERLLRLLLLGEFQQLRRLSLGLVLLGDGRSPRVRLAHAIR
jgi:hypothetical protein